MQVAIYVRRKIADSSLTLMRALRERPDVTRCFRVTADRPRSAYGNVQFADYIINWGNSHRPHWADTVPGKWYNAPYMVHTWAHKTRSFRELDRLDISCVPWTTEVSIANQWLDEGYRVAVRTVLQGHSGDGIEIVTPEEGECPTAPLYTRLVRGTHKREYRVLFAEGQSLLWLRKRRRNGFSENPDADPLIRTHANGWVYAPNDVWRIGEAGTEMQVNANRILSRLQDNAAIDFGSLDIIGDVATGEVTVLEINTAPGLNSESSLNAMAGGIL